MATQIVSPVVPQQKSAALQFPSSFLRPISQMDLETVILLRNNLKRKEEQLASVEADLKARLEAGASVEEGVHTAELQECSRRAVAWKSIAADLANTVFGEGKGPAYCEEILNSAEPTRTVNLKVQ